MTDTPANADNERHAMKMAKKKAARDKIMATKTRQKRSDHCPHRPRGKANHLPLSE